MKREPAYGVSRSEPYGKLAQNEYSEVRRPRPTVEIPISAGKRIAEQFGYDQVIIIARKCSTVAGVEHVTTYGVNQEHCNVAKHIGDFLKYKVMKWPKKTNM